MTCGCQLLHSIGLCHSVQRHDLDGNENSGRSNILATRRREVPFEKTPKSSKCKRVRNMLKKQNVTSNHQNPSNRSKRANTKKGRIFRQGLHSTQVNKDGI